jgi:amino acid transporter
LAFWWSAGRKRGLRTTGILLVAYGIASHVGSYFPMHQRGATGSLTDTMHIVLTIALVLLIFLFIAFGANAAGRWFRFYSIGTIVTLLVFGALAGMQGPRIAANLPTPYLGITERVNVYSAMLWVLVLGVVLLRSPIPTLESQAT